jgi:DNA-binding MurR/RpiR family transcriptional regulator
MYQERIREIYVHLSPGYRRIADFLLNRYQDAAFMTAAQVGKSSDVDTTLVVRFAQRLGYPGFPELIDDIQADVKRDLQAVYETAPEDTTPIGVVQRALIQDRNNVEYMLLHMDPGTVQKAVDLLDKAPRVFLTGDLGAIAIVEAFATRLLLLGISAHVVSSELTGQVAVAMDIKPEDVFLGIGATPLAVGVAAVLKMARDAGAQTIGIVDSPTNPVAAAAEYMIVAPVRSAEALPSWTALAAMLQGLVAGLSARRPGSVADWVVDSHQRFEAYVEELEKTIQPMRESIKGWYAANRE